MKLDFAVLLRAEYLAQMLHGLVLTLELTLLCWVLAHLLGTLLALIRMTNNWWANAAVGAYVEYHRNVPMLVHMFLWYFGIPMLLPDAMQQWANAHHSEFLFAFLAVGLTMAAYVCEDLRSGIRAIPPGQFEAARALGLGYLRAFWKVILPQGARNALPPLVNHTVVLLKNTSLAMTIGVAELTYATREIENHTYRTFETYLVSTLIYLALSLLIMVAGAGLERRYRTRVR
jgi:polar amino acid transport system permease protein